jgi:isopentenyl diphosphate isomerase/L-lactate dehydrogenase-like FMN-dependent dehydrogenase
MHPGGEVVAARAAGEAGTAYILSTISGHKLENVKAGSSGPVFYQLYLLGGRETAESSLDRARRAGFPALVITVDTSVAGLRERDPRNAMKELLSNSLFAKISYFPNILAHPGWLASFLLDWRAETGERRDSRQRSDGTHRRCRGSRQRHSYVGRLALDSRSVDGPIVVKGLLTGDDARRAVDEGASAVVVSNHGGRQLD